MFIKENDKTYRFIDADSDIVVKTLENKLFEVEKVETMFGSYYNFNENNAYDKGKVAKAGVFKELHEYVEDYFSDAGKEVREAMALPNRLGMLLTGEPGTGKTFLGGQLAKYLREHENAIGITTTKPFDIDLGKVVDMARKGDNDRLVVMIWDEFEKNYNAIHNRDKDRKLNELLAFLDGVDSRDNLVIIATCNNLSMFPNTLLDRPGRFEKVSEFKITDDVVLRTLIEAMLPEKYVDKVDAKLLFLAAKKMDNVSVDKIKSLVRDSLVNMLQGKKDYIPKNENRANTIPEPSADIKLKKFKEQKVNLDKVRDLVYDMEDDYDEVAVGRVASACK